MEDFASKKGQFGTFLFCFPSEHGGIHVNFAQTICLQLPGTGTLSFFLWPSVENGAGDIIGGGYYLGWFNIFIALGGAKMGDSNGKDQ